MSKLKVIKLILIFAAIIFIAKPFMGFSGSKLLKEGKDNSIILVKAFTKRVPEYLEEAEIKKAAVQQLLNNPPAGLVLSITTLLSLLFPLIYQIKRSITGQFIDQLSVNSLQDERTYLLTGKLTI
jgi:hypothetical protein